MDQLIRQNRPGLSRLVVLLIAAALLALSAVGLTVTTTGGPGGAAVVGVASADPAEAPAAPADDDKPGLGERLGKVWGDFERCRSVGLYGDLCLGKGVVDAGVVLLWGRRRIRRSTRSRMRSRGSFRRRLSPSGTVHCGL